MHATGLTRTLQVTLIISIAEPVNMEKVLLFDAILIPSRLDLRVIGQTTRLERSTIEQVRARIAYLREKTKESSNARSYDFDQRLADLKAKEAAARAEKKARRKAEKEEALLEMVDKPQQDELALSMGFSGFGSTKK
jgi:U4/U6.U5 tri-snRNP component SNU23